MLGHGRTPICLYCTIFSWNLPHQEDSGGFEWAYLPNLYRSTPRPVENLSCKYYSLINIMIAAPFLKYDMLFTIIICLYTLYLEYKYSISNYAILFWTREVPNLSVKWRMSHNIFWRITYRIITVSGKSEKGKININLSHAQWNFYRPKLRS